MTTWFTSDIRFGHRNIITHCNRPYTTVEEMNEALISNWLRVVKPEDIIFVLGDFSFEKHPENVFRRLTGTKVLIRGNHDHDRTVKLPWDAVHDYFEFKIDSDVICMSHFPMLSWHRMHRNSYMFHGHCHGTLEYPNSLVNSRIFDVGVDNIVKVTGEYGPISWNQARLHLRKREFTKVDHHG